MNVKVRETSHSGQAYPDRQDLCVCARVGLSVRGVHIESCIPGEPNYLSISLTGPLRETDRAGERREIGKRIRISGANTAAKPNSSLCRHLEMVQ